MKYILVIVIATVLLISLFKEEQIKSRQLLPWDTILAFGDSLTYEMIYSILIEKSYAKIYLKTLGSFCGEVIFTCLLTFILPKTTSISLVLTPNSFVKNFTR